MNLQDQYRYDSALFGLNNQYIERADKTYLINYPNIVARDHIVQTGHTYMLIYNLNDGSIDNMLVKLMEVYNDNININLVMFDLLKQKGFITQLNAQDPNDKCPWVLIDVHYIRDEIERFIVMRYCGCE